MNYRVRQKRIGGPAHASEMIKQIGKGTTWVFRADGLDQTFEELKQKE
jgi:hypothetical protein